MGDKYCVADVQAYVVLSWSKKLRSIQRQNKKAMRYRNEMGGLSDMVEAEKEMQSNGRVS